MQELHELFRTTVFPAQVTARSRCGVSACWHFSQFGMPCTRVTANWRDCEKRPGAYDFGTLAAILDRVQASDAALIVDVAGLSIPQRLDMTRHTFADALVEFSWALAEFLKSRRVNRLSLIPVSEIEVLAWASCEQAILPPYFKAASGLAQRHLLASFIRAAKVFRLVLPHGSIHVVQPFAGGCNSTVLDTLFGHECPELGGGPGLVDALGLACYESFDHQTAQPFREDLLGFYERFQLPVYLAEPHAFHEATFQQFAYWRNEIEAAHALGVPILGSTLPMQTSGLARLSHALRPEPLSSRESSPRGHKRDHLLVS